MFAGVNLGPLGDGMGRDERGLTDEQWRGARGAASSATGTNWFSYEFHAARAGYS